MEPGDKVRIRANPSKVGTLGRATDGPPTRLKVLVTWSDGEEQFVLKSSLEVVDQAPQGPYEMIRVGSFGRAGDLRGAITHYRLTGKLANLIYSLETTNTKFLPYQFKPVLQFLDSPCNGILIADEVGLGKTIEAGLIWTELRARQDARRLLVVCPAMLRDKWRRELNDRFGVRAEIVDADGVLQKLVELKERPNMGFALIASLQGLRPSRRWNDADEPAQSASAKLARLLDEQQGEDPVFDLTIVDEAHYLRNEGTQTHKLGQLLRPCTQSLVLLSATPVQLHSRDLFNLVNLLDEDAFPFESSFAQTLQANAPVLALRDRVRREPIAQGELRAELGAVMEHWAFDGNQQLEYLRDNIPAPEALARPEVRAELADRLDRINPLAKVITRTMKRDVDGERPERKPHVIRAELSKIEAQFYDQVTNAIREYCSRRSVSEGFMLTIPQRQMSSCMAAACMGWDARASQEEIEETLYEAFGDDPENEDPIDTAGIGSLSAELMRIARSIGNTQQLRLHDTKYAIFVKQLKEYWAANPGKKIVLFAFYRKTLDYLHERLSQDDIHAVLLYGGMEKELVLRDFERREGASILLSSEVASEGVDLQFSSLLVNYDLPWNPARIEQRVGRIDRIGQDERQILIWNLLYKDTLDERVHDRLLTRLNIFQQALGVTEAVLGQEIQALSRELLTHKLTPEQEQSRIDRAAMALENSKQQEARLENEAATLIAHGEFIQNKVKAAKELGRYIQGEDLTAYIRDGLERTYPGTRLISVSSDDIQQRLELSTEARSDISDFLQKHRLQGRTAVLSAMPPILLFENKLGRTPPQIERVTQDHPLVRFVSDRLRMSPGGLGYCPVSAIELAGGAIDGLNPGIYVYAVSRWSVSGARDLERLEYVVRPLNEHYFLDPDAAEQLVNTAALRGSDWLGVAAKVDTHNAATLQDLCSQEIERRFEEFKAAEQRANADRVRLMVSSLERHLANKERRSEELIQAHRVSGSRKRMGLINAERAKVQKERIRIEGRIAELRLREQITAHESAVSSGLIRAR